MAAMIKVDNLYKRFRSTQALAGVSFEIDEGQTFGFIGPNGAGKTTTIKVLATLLEPNGGKAWVDGHDCVRDPMSVRKIIGYMPDFFGVYDEMKVWEYLDFFAAAYRIPRDKRPAIINDVLDLTDLTGKKDEFVEGLSRGMKQRLCLARCLVHDPKVLLLDEPASGLDPRARVEFRELIKELRKMGKTILVSSHILTELADFCTHIGIIEQGKMIVTGGVDDIRSQLRPNRMLKIKILGDPEPARTLITGFGDAIKSVGIDEDNGNTLRVEFEGGDDLLVQIQKKLNEAGIGVTSFSEEEEDLEGIFMKVTKGIVS